MSKLCKNVALVLACLMAGAASVQAKTRPVEAVASQPAPYYNPSLYCHNVTLSYGVISNYGIKRMFQGLFPALQESMYDEGIRMGAVTFGYTYDLSSKLSVGGMFSYAGALGTIAAIPTTYLVYQNFFSIMPQVKFTWWEKGTLRLYSRLAAGVVVANVRYQESVSVETPLTTASFAFQVSPIGLEFGRSLAGFVEAGFGATGVVSVGLRKSF